MKTLCCDDKSVLKDPTALLYRRFTAAGINNEISSYLQQETKAKAKKHQFITNKINNLLSLHLTILL